MTETLDIRQNLLTCLMDDQAAGTTNAVEGTVTTAVPVDIPGIEPSNALRRYEITIPEVERVTQTLSGGGLVEEGTLFATAVTRAGKHHDRTFIYAMADAITAKCTAGDISVTTGGATIQIRARPNVGALFTSDDGTEWRLPVTITYRATKAS